MKHRSCQHALRDRMNRSNIFSLFKIETDPGVRSSSMKSWLLSGSPKGFLLPSIADKYNVPRGILLLHAWQVNCAWTVSIYIGEEIMATTKHVLLTGASGFVAMHILRELIEVCIRVAALTFLDFLAANNRLSSMDIKSLVLCDHNQRRTISITCIHTGDRHWTSSTYPTLWREMLSAVYLSEIRTNLITSCTPHPPLTSRSATSRRSWSIPQYKGSVYMLENVLSLMLWQREQYFARHSWTRRFQH